jgi:hypothetical protein
MRTQRRGARQATRFVLLVMALGWTVASLTIGWASVDDARGATVDAEVVDILTNVPGRRVYNVRFEAAGTICWSRIDSGSNPDPREIHVGAHSRVHYSRSDPCRKLRETSSPAPWPFPVFTAATALFCVAGVWRLRPAAGKYREALRATT